MPTRKLCVMMLLVCLVLMPIARAAEVSGIVTDATGATLVSARVLLINLSSLETKAAEIRETGKFDFLDLPAGDYALVTVSPKHTPCFKPVIKQFTVTQSGNAKISIKMQLHNERCSGIVN